MDRRIAAFVTVCATLASFTSAQVGAVSGESPLVFSLDLQSGEQQWQTRVASGEANPLVLFADRRRVFVQVRRCQSEDRPYQQGDSVLVALDADTGKEQWRRREVGDLFYSERGSEPTPPGLLATVALRRFPSGSIPIVSRRTDEVWAIDPMTGRERWRTDARGLDIVAISPDLVILGAQRGKRLKRVMAIDRGDGGVLWDVDVHSGRRLVAAATDQSTLAVLVGSSDSGSADTLLIFDREGHRKRTMRGLSFEFGYGLSVVRDSVVLGSTRVIDARTGTERWPPVPSTSLTAVTTLSGRGILFGQHTDGAAVANIALDVRDGMELWRTSEAHTTIIEARSNTALAVTNDDHFIAYDALDGTERWRRAFSDFGQAYYLHTPFLRLGPSAVYVSRGCEATSLD